MKKLLVVAVAILAALAGGSLVDGLLGDESGEERIQEYLTGTGDHEYVSSEAKFRAVFPGKPARATEDVDAGGSTFTVVAFAKEYDDAGFSVAMFPWAAGQAFDFDAGVNGIAVEKKAKVASSTKVKAQGFDAVEYVLVGPDSTHVKGLLIRARDRVYQLEAKGKDNPPAGYDKFKASFQITP
jgi:hypothetical protein